MVQDAIESKTNRCSWAVLVAGAWIAMSCQLAVCQTSPAPVPSGSPVTAAPEQPPVYEVTTVKPFDGNGWYPPLRAYIQGAFGIPPNTTGWVIGPDWINSASYVIQGKPPDSIRDAMQTMTSEERTKEIRGMEQSLLADRFKLKAHFETREMPMYELVVAKGGSKLTESPDSAKMRVAVGTTTIKGAALMMRSFAGLLPAVPELDGREVVDKTGLGGAYDLSLKWTPMQATAPGGESGAGRLPDADGPSLFTAIEEQLGLKLVPTKGPGQVLVIDHIERPSEN